MSRKTGLLQLYTSQRVFEAGVQVTEPFGNPDLRKHALAHLFDLGLAAAQTAELFLILAFTRKKLSLFGGRFAFERLESCGSPLSFRIKQHQAVVQRLLIAVEFLDSQAKLVDLLLLKSSTIACAIRFEFNGRRALAQLRELIFRSASMSRSCAVFGLKL